MQVYLPNGYDDSSINYPVLYLINGGGTDDTAWLDGGHNMSNWQNYLKEYVARIFNINPYSNTIVDVETIN